MDTQECFEQEKLYHMPTYARLPVVFVRGEGMSLWDSAGRAYLDFISGIGVVNLGHCHPAVIQAFSKQASELVHVSNLFYTKPQVELARKLSELTIGGQCFFANSGAEANEGAIKLARRYGKTRFDPERHEIVTALRSFHGRTMKALAATGQPEKQEPFKPLPGGFKHVPYNDLDALDRTIGPKAVAVMLEAIQGEGGVYPATRDYMVGVRQLCDERGLLLILDEVQSGMGRTGKLFAYQHFGIEPDIVTLAKGLANGFPMGALVAKADVARSFSPGDHGTTFGGGPAICAAALAVLSTLEAQALPEHAAELGAHFKAGLERLAAKNDVLIDVRGLGLMLGVELAVPQARRVVEIMLDRGFVINNVGQNILRFLPPLVVTKGQIDTLLSVLSEALVEAGHAQA